MWETTVQASREAVVEVPPEHAWALVSDSAAWSLRPGRFAFDVPGSADAGTPAEGGRLRCWFVPLGTGLACSVQEVCDEIPGQTMSLRSRGSQPAGRQTFTLSVLPHGRGALIRLAVTDTALRENKAECKAFWQKDFRAWISALKDVAEGRQPWPEAGIPTALRQANAARPVFASPQGTSVAVLIAAPLDAVWRAVRAPGIPADPRQPYTMICAGRVPGTAERTVGAMPYVIVRHADGQLSASVSMVKEVAEGRLAHGQPADGQLSGGRSALAQRLEPPHFEMHYLVEPAAGGTRLTQTLRWPDAPVTDEGEQLRSRLTQAVQQSANAYKTAIEQAAEHRVRIGDDWIDDDWIDKGEARG
jgi:hypothetical protein